jgi:hypothetical protein
MVAGNPEIAGLQGSSYLVDPQKRNSRIFAAAADAILVGAGWANTSVRLYRIAAARRRRPVDTDTSSLRLIAPRCLAPKTEPHARRAPT